MVTVAALAVLLGVAAWRGWVEFTAETHPAPEEQATGRAEFKPGRDLGLIDFATNQLAWAGAPPASPFLPTLEALAADPGAAAAMRERRGRGGREGATPGGAAKDPFAHLRGDTSLAEATDLIVVRTRQFAVRQLRWFQRDPRIEWVDVERDPVTEAASRVARALG